MMASIIPTVDILRRAVLLLAAQLTKDTIIEANTRDALIEELKRWGLWKVRLVEDTPK